MTAYYNEFDPFAAQWLRNLITKGLIAPGDVDQRSIKEVKPDDLRSYTQHHFFAGIGGWSYALRLAGWPDDVPVWTGSCPCQPFSAAGRGLGFADERHLWPSFFGLIQECRPDIVFGEQVTASAEWVELVSSDLEREDYAFGQTVLGAHSVSAPHRRQRLYWLAESQREQPPRCGGVAGEYPTKGVGRTAAEFARCGAVIAMADSDRGRCSLNQKSVVTGLMVHERQKSRGDADGCSGTGMLGDTMQDGRGSRTCLEELCGEGRREEVGMLDGAGRTSPWARAEWIECRDGKKRPIEPGIQPLAHGVSSRVGKLRGAGNAIVPQVAQKFIEAYIDYTKEKP